MDFDSIIKQITNFYKQLPLNNRGYCFDCFPYENIAITLYNWLENYNYNIIMFKPISYVICQNYSYYSGGGESHFVVPCKVKTIIYCITKNAILLMIDIISEVGHIFSHPSDTNKYKNYQDVITGYEMFKFSNGIDTKTFIRSFRSIDGLFCDGVFFSNIIGPYSRTIEKKDQNYIENNYHNYLLEIDNYIKSFTGIYYYPLEDGWNMIKDENNKVCYFNENKKQITYKRPGILPTVRTGKRPVVESKTETNVLTVTDLITLD